MNNLKNIYESIFSKNQSEIPYLLNIVNSAKKIKKGIFSSQSKAPCDFCGSKDCMNCSFPYRDDIQLSECQQRIKNFTKGLKLIVV